MSSSISRPGAGAAPNKFGFDNSFDALADLAKSESGLELFTTADIDAAREDGRRQGHRAGRAEAEAETEHLAALTLTAIRDDLAGLHQSQGRVLRAVTEDSARLAVTLASKLAASLTRARPLDEIEAVVGEVLERLALEPRVVVWVADSLLDPLNARIDALAEGSGFAGKIVLLSAPEMAPGDCRLEWADGGTERLAEEVERAIDATIDELLAVGLEPGEAAPPSSPDPATPEATPPAPTPDPATPHA